MAHQITDSLICPITQQLFLTPVLAEDGYTYEESAIVAWIQQNHTSPMTRKPLSVEGLHPNRIIKDLIEEFENSLRSVDYRFKIDVDIRKQRNAIFQANTKSIYHAEWITRRNAPRTILLKNEWNTCKKRSILLRATKSSSSYHTNIWNGRTSTSRFDHASSRIRS